MAESTKIIKIAVTGPESSGKSFTAEFLARKFDGWYVPEYAREYLTHLNRPYNYKDVVNIAYGQLEVENRLVQDAVQEDVRFIFFDGELINTKIWLDEKFGACEEFIIKSIEQSDYDHYLLMKPDIAWEPDPLRENPDDRDRLFQIHIQHLDRFQKPYSIIGGDYAYRNHLSVAIVRSLMFQHP